MMYVIPALWKELNATSLNLMHYAFQIFFPYYGCGFMFTGMAPSGWHYHVQKFIFKSRRIFHITEQGRKFTKIYIGKTSWLHLSCYAIFNRNLFFFIHVSSKNFIPNIQQVAKISVHVIRVTGMMNTVVRGG